jgi:hypothetical protein
MKTEEALIKYLQGKIHYSELKIIRDIVLMLLPDVSYQEGLLLDLQRSLKTYFGMRLGWTSSAGEYVMMQRHLKQMIYLCSNEQT